MKHIRNATVALTIFPLPVILETCPHAAFLDLKHKICVNVLVSGAADYIGRIFAYKFIALAATTMRRPNLYFAVNLIRSAATNSSSVASRLRVIPHFG